MKKILTIFIMVLSLSCVFLLASCDKKIDVSNVTFSDATYDYDGTAKKIEVQNLPDGVEVEYDPSNSQTEAGVYRITATIMDEEGNVLIELTAVLTIEADEETDSITGGETGGEEETLPEHTCSFDGEWKKDETNHWHECSCGETDTPVSHTWNAGEVTIEPTETTKGKKVYTCTVCSQIKEEELPVVTHTCSFGTEWKKDATDHWLECECGETSEKAAHTWDEGEVTVEPTEEAEGKKVYTCSVCGQTKEEVVDKLQHVHNYGATWESDETNHWHECSCSAMDALAAHTWDEGEVTLEPTEETTGLKVLKCTVCEQTKEVLLPKLDHTCEYSDEWIKDEIDHWKECRCGAKIGKTSHTWNDGQVTVQPTEESKGKKVYTCTVCDQTKEEVLEELEHVHNHTATLSKDETQHWYECACGDKKDIAEHSYGEWKYDANKHWKECACGYISEEDEHEGGKATITEKAVCTICDQSYGDLEIGIITVYLDLTDDWTNVLTPYFNDKLMTEVTSKNGKFVIEVEGNSITSFRLDFRQDDNGKEAWFHVTSTNTEQNTKYELAYNFVAGKEYKVTNIHYSHTKTAGENDKVIDKFYTCKVEEILPHICEFGTELYHDETGHWTQCECGEKSELVSHEFNSEIKYDTEHHWIECVCGEKNEVTAHTFGTVLHHDSTGHWTLCSCGAKSQVIEHTFGDVWESNEENHWHLCDCGEKSPAETHLWSEGTITKYPTEEETGLKDVECLICGKTSQQIIPELEHVCEFGEELHHDSTGHWTVCECNAKSELVEHIFDIPNKDENNHWNECVCGEMKNVTAHEFSTEWKHDNNNHWYECSCGQENSVTEHNYSDSWKYDDNKHWFECVCGLKSNEAEHQGGKATTTEKAVCDVCEQPYGELEVGTIIIYFNITWSNVQKPHFNDVLMTEIESENGKYMIEVKANSLTSFRLDFRQDDNGKETWFHVIIKDYKENDKNNTKYELACDLIAGKEYKVTNIHYSHTKDAFEGDTVIDKFYYCSIEEIIPHVCEFGTQLYHDETGHWTLCECGAKSEIIAHAFGEELHRDGKGHWTVCECGAKSEVVEHEFAEMWESDEDKHWHTCVCGELSPASSHEWNEGTIVKEPSITEEGLKKVKCKVCDKEATITVPKLDHTHEQGTELHHDSTGHWTQCECGEKSEVIAHTFDKNEKDNESHWKECVCGETQDVVSHEYGSNWKKDNESHWKECSCGAISEKGSHEGGKATTTAKAVCNGCGSEYGELIPMVVYTLKWDASQFGKSSTIYAWCWGDDVAGDWYDLTNVGSGTATLSIDPEIKINRVLLVKSPEKNWDKVTFQTDNFELSGQTSEVNIHWNITYTLDVSKWTNNDERYAVYLCNGTAASEWVDMTKVADNKYAVTLSVAKLETHKNIIFVRMNGKTTENNWDNKWNQSADLAIKKDSNEYKAASNGEWNQWTV